MRRTDATIGSFRNRPLDSEHGTNNVNRVVRFQNGVALRENDVNIAVRQIKVRVYSVTQLLFQRCLREGDRATCTVQE